LNGAIAVFKKPRHPFIFDCIAEINSTYKPDEWGWNGPLLFTRVWRERWKEQNPTAVAIQDSTAFQMFRWEKLEHHCFGNESSAKEAFDYAVLLSFKVPYAVHLNNAAHGHLKTIVPGTFCEYLLTRYCIFCDKEPVRPAAYPKFEYNGVVVALP
jgi:hypothetical protein